jgi:threonine aldolase
MSEAKASGAANGLWSSKVSAWSNPGPAAFDFRSDVVTSPTQSMLRAIQETSLLDDVYAEDPTTISLERHIASMTGQESAVFTTSGTQANLIAARSHLTAPPYSLLCDSRAHVIVWEAGGIAALTGCMTRPVHPSNDHHLTLEDVKANVILSDDVHMAPTRLICIENTIEGAIMPLEEVRRISEFARANDIRLHMDGARLWNAVAAGAGSLKDYVGLCDSVSMCFSKGLGAPIGSILVGNEAFVKRARWIRKSIGGGMRQAGVVTAPARVAVDETFGTDGGLLKHAHANAAKLGKMWESMGGKLVRPVETNMVWLDLEDAQVTEEEFAALGKKHGVKCGGEEGRTVVHYQNSDEAIERMGKAMKDMISMKGTKKDFLHQGAKKFRLLAKI